MNQQMVKHSVVKCGVALDVAGDGAEAVALVEARLGESRVSTRSDGHGDAGEGWRGGDREIRA